MKLNFRAAAFGLAAMLSSRAGMAEEPSATSAVACDEVNRRSVVACALATSPALREELAAQRAGQGRRETASLFLPTNPVLAGSMASRTGPTDSAFNWYLSLGQEVEVAGQRGLRVEVADAELRAQTQRTLATRATVAAQTWSAYFRAIAAKERIALAKKLVAATATVATTARAMATQGLTSDLEADIADAAALRAAQERLSLEAQVATANAELQWLVGAPSLGTVVGTLEPLKVVGAGPELGTRPELLALKDVRAALEQRVALLRRERIPNPTVSVFAQNDGFNERVYGVGVSIPIPLPQPIGRTRSGEVQESLAFTEKAEAEIARVQRGLLLELTSATAAYDASAKGRALYTPERVERATVRLESITAQIKAGRLAVRDALVAQQALVDQLKADIEAREALCMASVRLTRAAGLSLEGDSL